MRMMVCLANGLFWIAANAFLAGLYWHHARWVAITSLVFSAVCGVAMFVLCAAVAPQGDEWDALSEKR
ncbi:MAG: hypothetical protein KF774_17700 [Planctomyces sp.]|nr:hypothetical protein [Planctomyces sp.]